MRDGGETWVRFEYANEEYFGTLFGGRIHVYSGDLFGEKIRTDRSLHVDEIRFLIPTPCSKIVALWNNSRSLAKKQNIPHPTQPLYFLKTPQCYLAHRGEIRQPLGYKGRVLYEGELGIVIGRTCAGVPISDAEDFIFGFTCINDVTAIDLLYADNSFPQWTRAKNFDTFGVIGPGVATDIDVSSVVIQTELNGRVRQNNSVSDMFFSPAELVSRISFDLTLVAGDIIACGSGPGALPMRDGSQIDIVIDGVGRLSNTFIKNDI